MALQRSVCDDRRHHCLGSCCRSCAVRAYVTYTFVLAALIYPVVAGMVWYGGDPPILEALGFAESVEGTAIGGGLIAGGILSIEANAFAPQVLGVFVITVGTVLATGAVWGAFRAIGQARVTPEHEHDGLDVSEHGVDTHPEFGSPDVVTDGGKLQSDGGERSTDSRSSSDRRSDGGTVPEDEISLVTAIVRPDRLAAVKRELANVGDPHLP
jgi:hypothetical protein